MSDFDDNGALLAVCVLSLHGGCPMGSFPLDFIVFFAHSTQMDLSVNFLFLELNFDYLLLFYTGLIVSGIGNFIELWNWILLELLFYRNFNCDNGR